MRSISKICVMLLMFTGVFFLTPEPAHAGRVRIPYHTGQDIFPTGPIPGDFAKDPQLAGYQAGYICDIWGVVWAYFKISECKPVVFKDDTYGDKSDLAPELYAAITKAYSEDDMQIGFWTKHGRWILGLGVGGLILFGIFGKSDDDDDEEEQSDDESESASS